MCIRRLAAVTAALFLVGCLDDDSGLLTDSTPAQGGGGVATVPVSEDRAGVVYHQVLASAVDGVDVSFQVFEPDELKAGQTYPLVLHGHGYGGSRTIEKGGFIARLTAAGYYVISIDQRGFGDAGGTVRTLSPDFEGQDLVQILDWAEDLPGLRRSADGNMLVGSYGGSYGGGYQLLLLSIDPKKRLDALAPDITWHDLTYSLAPGGVVKSGYGLALAGAGEAGAQSNPDPQGGQDPFIFETLIQATLTNSFSEASFNMFRYHSLKYFCDGQPAGPQNFVVAEPDPLLVPAVAPPRADVLLTQGFRDSLFNFTEAYWNYECLKQAGGDVRLLTHQSGHILPVSLTSAPGAEPGLDPFYAALTAPNFQDAGGSRTCGSISLDDAQFAWFEQKLQGKPGAVDAVLSTGSNVCLSLAEGDAVETPAVKVGGTSFPLDNSIPQFNAAIGVGGAVLGNGAREALLAVQPLFTAGAGGAIIAGIPEMNLNMAGLSGLESEECAAPLAIGACDPILLLAIAHRAAGTERWDVIDDQLTPIRGLGVHAGRMGGIAERLAEGDELALLVFGFHAQFPVTWSRDIFVPAVDLSGEVSLPILDASEVVREGV